MLVARLVREEVRPHVARLALAVACMAVVAAATAAYAYLMEPVLNEIFANKDRTMLVVLPLIVVAVFLAKGVAGYGQTVLMNGVGQRIVANMRNRMFAHLIGADLAFHNETTAGTLISRFTNDARFLSAAVATALTGMIKESLTVVFLVAVMFYQEWRLALAAVVLFPIALFPVAKIGRRMRRIAARSQAQVGRLAALLNETMQGARHVKAYGMEDYEIGRARGAVEELYRLLYKALRVRALSTPIMENLGGIAIAVVIFYGGSQVIAGATTTGAFFSFITALLLAYEPMKRLAKLNVSMQEGLAAAQRIYAVLDTEPAIRDRPGARALVVRAGTVAFEGVRFSYGRGAAALADVTLTAPGGRTTALVGPSGAGKSTILNLIPRFYDVDAGRVLIDGLDVRDATLASLRTAIALVSQEVTLFNDTARANIAYGRPGASDAEIEAAARAAAADGFIRALDEGYETVLGEHGLKLSAGQRQRIAIARAMLKDAPILLLDEPTSALDAESEHLVQEALARLTAGRTTLVIAHRLATVIRADRIYAIEGGRVAEAGTHAELLAKDGAYARLYELQFADDAERPPRPARARA